jgi:type I restriction enzyme M protein
MLTGELRSKIDAIWNDFWSGGLSNPLQVIEQIKVLHRAHLAKLDALFASRRRRAFRDEL